MSTAIIQHRYNLRSIARQAMNQPVVVEETPIIKISIFVYLLKR